MWLSSIEETSEAWLSLEPLTLLYPYKSVQKKITDAFFPYLEIPKRYSESTKQTIQLLSDEYVQKQPDVIEQNVALLKNAIELWKTAAKVSDAIAPILLHYSWHCFNSFFVYSIFRWEPRHTKSHGVKIVLSDELKEIEIQILETGLFKRLIDTFTIIGTPLVFSRFLPLIKNEKIEFMSNDNYLPDQNNRIPLKQLLDYDAVGYEKTMYASRKDELITAHFLPIQFIFPINLFKPT